jgi:hypothetical protein
VIVTDKRDRVWIEVTLRSSVAEQIDPLFGPIREVTSFHMDSQRRVTFQTPPPRKALTPLSAMDADVVVTFRASQKTILSKQQTLEDVKKAEEQYNRLLATLSDAGLLAVGRRGDSLGHLLVFVKTPERLLQSLLRRER